MEWKRSGLGLREGENRGWRHCNGSKSGSVEVCFILWLRRYRKQVHYNPGRVVLICIERVGAGELAMLCKCSNQFKFDESETGPSLAHGSRELSAKLREGEAKLLQGSIREAEVSLREALSFNNEEARALLGRLEYERGNYEAALQVLEEIQAHTVVSSLRLFIADFKKQGSKKGRQYKDGSGGQNGVLGTFLHGASLLLEALYLKAKCLQELDRLPDATHECTLVLDEVESAIPAGLPPDWGHTRLADMLSQSVTLLPHLLSITGHTTSALFAYRRALLRFSWCLPSPTLIHIMKSLAILLLYSGSDTTLEPTLQTLKPPTENALTPTEEAILLLLLLLRTMTQTKDPSSFDPTIFDHLTFAFSTNSQLLSLAQHYESLLPGSIPRPDRWYSLALCYSQSHPTRALNLLRKSLAPKERPKHVPSLLLASKLCLTDPSLCEESLGYAKCAVVNASTVGYEARALHLQGVVLSLHTKMFPEAVEILQDAVELDKGDCAVVFDLGLALAGMKRTREALECAKWCLGRGMQGGLQGRVQGWRMLALLLSAQERWGEADGALEVALEEVGVSVGEKGPLWRTRAKVQAALGLPLLAVRSYQLVLAGLRAERKERELGVAAGKVEHCKVEEAEVWHDLARVYTQLKQWQDAETCLEKARLLDSFSVPTWHNRGLLHEERGHLQEAMACYNNALALDATYVDSKVKLGALLFRMNGRSAIPMAKSYLAEALEVEPTHVEAWYHMGMLHKADGQKREAAKSFHAAVVQEQSSPVEKYSSITPALLW